MSKIELTLLGGGREIGANSYLLSVDGHQVLFDCGTHPKREGYEALPDFDLIKRTPEAVFISHGHVDHCGALPLLLKQYPSTIPYATRPTTRIMDRMLHNSVAVMYTIAKERGISEYPLYEHGDVDSVMRKTNAMEYGVEFSLKPSSIFRASLHHAGHVLGSSSILLKSPEHTVVYTGDICVADQELMGGRKPLPPSTKVDTLIIESTYGANDTADDITYDSEIERFGVEISKVIDKNGIVLVPAFALGRIQELLNVISRLQETGKIQNVPVYTSGLGRAIYEVYEKFSHNLKQGASLRPLSNYRRVGDVWNEKIRKKLLSEPCIIVATSGMMLPNTPSAMLAQEIVRHKHHGIFFVGYLDPDTLGYKLLNCNIGDSFLFHLEGKPVTVDLENKQWFHFSAHAPRKTLKAVIEELKPKNVVFVHGDPKATKWMHDNSLDSFRTFMPKTGESIIIEE